MTLNRERPNYANAPWMDPHGNHRRANGDEDEDE